MESELNINAPSLTPDIPVADVIALTNKLKELTPPVLVESISNPINLIKEVPNLEKGEFINLLNKVSPNLGESINNITNEIDSSSVSSISDLSEVLHTTNLPVTNVPVTNVSNTLPVTNVPVTNVPVTNINPQPINVVSKVQLPVKMAPKVQPSINNIQPPVKMTPKVLKKNIPKIMPNVTISQIKKINKKNGLVLPEKHDSIVRLKNQTINPKNKIPKIIKVPKSNLGDVEEVVGLTKPVVQNNVLLKGYVPHVMVFISLLVISYVIWDSFFDGDSDEEYDVV